MRPTQNRENKMKRIFVILGVCLIAVIAMYAQLIEVKGVETSQVAVNTNNIRFDFEFRNTNNFKVSVEAEMWTYDQRVKRGEYRVNAVDFVLGAGETYIWKVGVIKDRFVKYKAYKVD